jgi:hypothetical protein
MKLETEDSTLIVFANKYDGAILEVLTETDKAISVRNKENGKTCWLPKAGLTQRKPGVPTYESEYNVQRWFMAKMTNQQERVLNLLE